MCSGVATLMPSCVQPGHLIQSNGRGNEKENAPALLVLNTGMDYLLPEGRS